MYFFGMYGTLLHTSVVQYIVKHFYLTILNKNRGDFKDFIENKNSSFFLENPIKSSLDMSRFINSNFMLIKISF